MKKVLAISSILLGVVFLSGCGQKPIDQIQVPKANPVTQEPVDTQTDTNKPAPTAPVVTPPVSTSKVYSSQKYGFEFKYPKEFVVTSASNANNVIISNSDDGRWIYNVRIENNANNLNLEDIALPPLATDTNTKITYITIDGIAAKRYSINDTTGDSDYGHAGVILIVGNNILTINGDDSTAANKAGFEALFSTFKFTK
jgi:outer membrane lipoprotein-sorting protein